MKGKFKFVLYTNPNNETNFAYKAIGARKANEVLQSAKEFPGSYRILLIGKGNEQDINATCAQFGDYIFV